VNMVKHHGSFAAKSKHQNCLSVVAQFGNCQSADGSTMDTCPGGHQSNGQESRQCASLSVSGNAVYANAVLRGPILSQSLRPLAR